ncbi:M20/M25/M40 family metallo-hydrolase [Pseudonocardia acaciae]|uniref:M20/M25/M40 family metallo-hydrolase n=1 Tax=Pseudonocardia acaciae TaxID=551276 RepID=UPI0006891553|nr:M20/M25/M40 family metallo-hydrolase [Pseudonocardia acaciae]
MERISRRTAMRIGGTAGLAALTAACSAAPSAPPRPKIDPFDLDPVELTKKMVRFDTSHNGEGGRTLPHAQMLRDIFDAAGARTEIIPTPKPDNAHFIARVPGAGRARPLLFLGHSDVVSVERERWSVDPYRADVVDGWVYGRGTLDMKGTNAAFVSALLKHLGEGARFDRDIVFLSDCDEEAGPHGTSWLAKQDWAKIDAGAVITEGGWILTRSDGVTPMLAAVTVIDKTAANVELTATGTTTHSSKPMPDSAIIRLNRAIGRLADYQPPVAITPTARPYFEALAAATDNPQLASAVRILLGAGDQNERNRAGDLVVQLSPYPWLHNALMRHTITQVIEQSGYRTNVMPGSASAIMNLRLIPGGPSVAGTLDQMRATLGGDNQLKLQLTARGLGQQTPEQLLTQYEGRLTNTPSGTDTDVYRALEQALKDTYAGVPVTPGPFEAGTSSSPWRERGIPVYGIYPYPVDNDTIVRMHGNDERVRADALHHAHDLMYRVLAPLRTP